MTVADSGGGTIGLVGGLGVGATVHYYEKLAKAFAGEAATPTLLISHANLTHVLGLIGRTALDTLADYLASHIDALARGGARFAAVSAVAPHICAPQLQRRIEIPLIDLIDCVRA